MPLSHLPDSAHPRVAVDPSVSPEERRALRENQDSLTPASGRAPSRFSGLIHGSVVRLVRRHHGRYVVAADLDPDAKILLCRAQAAIDAVLESEVNKAGLLDDMDNALNLPVEEWEIAQTLMPHSRMRAEQRHLRESNLTPMEKSRFAPQRDALRRSVAAVTKRIEALEAYAARTAAADSVYRKQQLAQQRHMPSADAHIAEISELERRNEAYEELLARTAAEELATERIEDLADDASEVESALRQTTEGDRHLDNS